MSVALKIGAKQPLRRSVLNHSERPIDIATLRDAVYRYADSVVAGDGRYDAITSVLKRDPPRIQGRRSGDSIVPAVGDLVPPAARAISELDRSHMLVQGPPGAGKTFLSAFAIVELMAQGRRVAVASNSHKAINNLLTEITRQALERGVTFRGVKKCTDEEHRCNAAMIADVFDNEEVSADRYDLVAGTAWLFARPEFDQAFDHLFIDEAGQVSLANVVAMGVSAPESGPGRRPDAISSPAIQGDHPQVRTFRARVCPRRRATVPPDRGVFLAETRRMHPDVCRFISEAVYEGRLNPEAATQPEEFVLGAGADPALRASGVRFVPVLHEDCS